MAVPGVPVPLTGIRVGGAAAVGVAPLAGLRRTIVFAALAVGRLVEDRTGWSIRKFVRPVRRYRTVQIRAGQQLITAADPTRPSYATPSPRSTGPRRALN